MDALRPVGVYPNFPEPDRDVWDPAYHLGNRERLLAAPRHVRPRRPILAAAMSHYERSTTSMTLATLPEPLRGAIRDKAEALHLTVADDAQAFLTHSRQRKKGGLFGRMLGSADPDAEHLTAMVIGAKDVLVARSGEKSGTQVLAARLEDADTQGVSPQTYAAAGIAPGDGMSVNGFRHSGESSRASFYVGLGPPEGDSARDALEAALKRAKA